MEIKQNHSSCIHGNCRTCVPCPYCKEDQELKEAWSPRNTWYASPLSTRINTPMPAALGAPYDPKQHTEGGLAGYFETFAKQHVPVHYTITTLVAPPQRNPAHDVSNTYKYSQGIGSDFSYEGMKMQLDALIASHREMMMALMYIRRNVSADEHTYNAAHIDRVIDRAAKVTK